VARAPFAALLKAVSEPHRAIHGMSVMLCFLRYWKLMGQTQQTTEMGNSCLRIPLFEPNFQHIENTYSHQLK